MNIINFDGNSVTTKRDLCICPGSNT